MRWHNAWLGVAIYAGCVALAIVTHASRHDLVTMIAGLAFAIGATLQTHEAPPAVSAAAHFAAMALSLPCVVFGVIKAEGFSDWCIAIIAAMVLILSATTLRALHRSRPC